ncbi:MAG TPA: helix-turn-helix domain-containing protein [Bryobacteraceae bacterium]|jgi:excisionase family DNA binding protein
MKFFKPVNQLDDSRPPITKPVPMRPKQSVTLDESEQLTDLKGVAKRLGVSKRFVQSLVKSKAIPVIRLGRRCVRFDPDAVLVAVKRFEVKEVQ